MSSGSVHRGATEQLLEIAARLRQSASDRDGLEQMESLIRQIAEEHQALERHLKWVEHSQRNLDARLLRIEHSRIFRLARRAGVILGWRRYRSGRLAEQAYRLWMQQQALDAPETREFTEAGPMISIALCAPKREWLEGALQSLRAQTYPNWELCVCDDCCGEDWLRDFVTGDAAADGRVRFVRPNAPPGMSGALNAAGALAKGDYIGFLRDGAVLAPHALAAVAGAVLEQRPALVYSDEDHLDGSGHRSGPLFKPDWDPELLLSCMYLGSFLVVSRPALDMAGWFHSEFDGAHHHDLALRIAELGTPVVHIPRILCHKRDNGRPISPSAHASRRAVEAAIARRGQSGRVQERAAVTGFRIRRTGTRDPLVSIVICSRNAKLLGRCLSAIERKTAYSQRELMIVWHHTGAEDRRMERLLAIRGPKFTSYEGPFNFAVMNNRGARESRGEILLFLNDDVEPLVAEWLEALVRQVQRPEVGIAGAKLLYRSGALQHAGIAIGISDGAGHPQRFSVRTCDWWPWTDFTRNVSAVTGACLAVRREVFAALDGFDAGFPENYNDVDLCLRARRAGYTVLCEPAAVLRHYEAQTRTTVAHYGERELFYKRWGDEIERGDPFYNPNLTRDSEAGSLRLR